MKKILAVAGIGAALTAASMATIGVASASPSADKDATFIACTSDNGIYNPHGIATGAAYGRQIANDIELGPRNPLQERDYVYHTTTGEVGVTQANVLVNCATSAYLGYGPGSTPPPADNGGTVV
jgi:hypothetical protein